MAGAQTGVLQGRGGFFGIRARLEKDSAEKKLEISVLDVLNLCCKSEI